VYKRQAERAFSQFDQADPSNRLVVDTLEKRWNDKLEKVAHVKDAIHLLARKEKQVSEEDLELLNLLGKQFELAWNQPNCAMKIKKRIARCVIKEIIADIDESNQMVNLVIHWQGGKHSQINIPRPMPANIAHKTAEEDVDIIRKMSIRYNDSIIAAVLSKSGRKTGKGNRWTSTSVKSLRQKHKIQAPKKDALNGILNLAQATKYCEVSNSTIMKMIEAGTLPSNQIVQHAPMEIRKSDLDSEPVVLVLNTLRKTGKLILGGGVSASQAALPLEN